MIERTATPRREQLLDATLRVIGELGIAAVTHRAVAAEAGLPLASTTYYFASKEELVEQALRFAAKREMERIDERLAELGPPPKVSPHALVDGLVNWLAEQLAGEARLRLLAQYQLQVEASRSERLRQVCREWHLSNLRLAEYVLAAVGSSDPQEDAELLSAAVDGIRLYQLSGPEAGFEEQRVRDALRRLVDLFVLRR